MAGQQGRVHVEDAPRRDVEHLLEQDLPVGDGDDDLGLKRGEFGAGIGISKGGRLPDRQAQLLGGQLHGWWPRLAAASGWAVGLGVDSGYDTSIGGEVAQAGDGEGRSPHEDDGHGGGILAWGRFVTRGNSRALLE